MTSDRPARALGWVGGKSFYGTHGTGRWITSLLPPAEATYTYVEPYSGMLGVLLQRRPAKREIVSDLDDDLINWWTVVRDKPDALGELLEWTPSWSSALFAEACQNLDHQDDVKRAYYFTLACHWVRGGMMARIRERPKVLDGTAEGKGADGLIKRSKTGQKAIDSAFVRKPLTAWEPKPEGYFEPVSNPDTAIVRTPRSRQQRFEEAETRNRPDMFQQPKGRPVRLSYDEMGPPRHPAIKALSKRIRRVQLETRSAEWIVEYYGVNPNLTFYIDPPYPSAEHSRLYNFPMPDIDEWIPRLLLVKGYCAISGYGDEWSDLEDKGWFRHEHLTHATAGAQGNMARPERTEVLWTNYNPDRFQQAQRSLFC